MLHSTSSWSIFKAEGLPPSCLNSIFQKKQIINSSNDFTLCLLWIFISPQQIMAAVLCAPVPRNQFTLIDSNTLCTRWKLHHQNMFGMIELDFCVNHLVKMHFSLYHVSIAHHKNQPKEVLLFEMNGKIYILGKKASIIKSAAVIFTGKPQLYFQRQK